MNIGRPNKIYLACLETLGDAISPLLGQLNIVALAAMRTLSQSWKKNIEVYASQCKVGNVVYLNKPVDFFVHKRIDEILKVEFKNDQYAKTYLCEGNLDILKLMSEWWVARACECFRINLQYFNLPYLAKSVNLSIQEEISNASISEDSMLLTEKLNCWIQQDEAKLSTFDKLVCASYIPRFPLMAFKHLQTLVTSGRFFFQFPTEICLLTSLTTLSISRAEFNDLPVEIGNLTNLERLSFALGKLISLPEEIKRLKKLTDLNLENNQLCAFPFEICTLTNLKSLDLNFNHIHILPEEICSLISLEYLMLQGSNLESLPTAIGDLTNLTHLNIKFNKILTLPWSMCALNLQEFYYYHNSMHVDFWAKAFFPRQFNSTKVQSPLHL